VLVLTIRIKVFSALLDIRWCDTIVPPITDYYCVNQLSFSFINYFNTTPLNTTNSSLFPTTRS